MGSRIFISHSIHGEPESPMLDLLENALNKDHEVFLDKFSLKPGEAWRSRIFCELMCCHAAIVIFNKKAMEESPWVPHEAQLLTTRRYMNDDFVLIPVWIDVDHTNFSGPKWEPLDFTRENAIRHDKVNETVTRIKDALSTLAGRRKTGYLERLPEMRGGCLPHWIARSLYAITSTGDWRNRNRMNAGNSMHGATRNFVNRAHLGSTRV